MDRFLNTGHYTENTYSTTLDLRQDLPSGRNTGVTISYWLVSLHMAHVRGLPFKIFVCVMGVVVGMLSVTGVYLWLKKRRSKAVAHARRTEPVTVSHA